jgi:Methyltransferase domain
LLKPEDHQRATILRVPVQDVPLATFNALESGDILFIDSTHVLKTCSDVEFELFCILPRLKPGVFIHFHDIFYPFEYPPQWCSCGIIPGTKLMRFVRSSCIKTGSA